MTNQFSVNILNNLSLIKCEKKRSLQIFNLLKYYILLFKKITLKNILNK